MSRSLRIVLAVAALQAVLVGVYWWVEMRRSGDQRDRLDQFDRPELGTAPPRPVDGPLGSLRLRAHDGTRHELSDLIDVNRATLVHFWATWCPPCRAELPALLSLSPKTRFAVVAVALDKHWGEVERFVKGRPPASVFLADADDVEAAFGIHTLPVTYLVEPGGRLRFRFDGARDWSDPAFLKRWGPGLARE